MSKKLTAQPAKEASQSRDDLIARTDRINAAIKKSDRARGYSLKKNVERQAARSTGYGGGYQMTGGIWRD